MSRWRARALLGAVFLVALGVRLLYLRELAPTVFGHALVADEEMYDARARAVAAGDLALGNRPYYQDPLYPYVLGGLYRLAGPDPQAARLAQAGLGAAAAALAAALALRLAGPIAALVAGLLMAFGSSLLFYDAQVEKTSLTVALTSFGLYLIARPGGPGRQDPGQDTETARDAHGPAGRLGRFHPLLCGLVWGGLALLRGNFLLLLPLAALAAALLSRKGGGGGREALGRLAAFTLGAVLALSPFTLRNRAVSGEWVLVTSQGGQNFYLGNWPGNPTGLYVPPPFVRAHPRYEEADFAREGSRQAGRELGAAATSRFWWRRGIEAVAARPARFLRFALLRVAYALGPVDVPDNHDRAIVARFVPLLRAPLPDFGLLVALGLPGLALASLGRGAAPQAAAARRLLGFVAAYLLTLAPFFVFGRYRMPLAPALAVGGGLLVAVLVQAARERNAGRAVAALGAVAVAAAGVALLPRPPLVQGQSLNTLGALLERSGDREGAAAAYREALATDPESALAAVNLARLLCEPGDPEPALALYRRAIALRPQLPEAHHNLGACLLDHGRIDEAVSELRQAVALDPGLGEAWFNLGDALAREGRGAEGALAYRQAARLPLPAGLALEARRRAQTLEAQTPPPTPAPALTATPP